MKPRLYLSRIEIERALRRLPYPWKTALADRVAAQLLADEERARVGPDRARQGSARVREAIITAIPPRLLHHPSATEKTLERIAIQGHEAMGLRRDPHITTVRAAVRVARERNLSDVAAGTALPLASFALTSGSSTA